MTKLSLIAVISLSFCQIILAETSAQKFRYDEKLNLSRNLIELDKFLVEAKKSFTFRDKPIHPRIIKDFEFCEDNSMEPYRISYDLNMGFDSNEYPNSDVTSVDDGWNIILDEKALTTYQYKFIGSLENELSIVISQNVRDGFLLNYTLHAFEFKIEQGLSHKDFKLYNRLVLKSYFQIRLGSINNISIKGNEVIVDEKSFKIERKGSADVEGNVYKI